MPGGGNLYCQKRGEVPPSDLGSLGTSFAWWFSATGRSNKGLRTVRTTGK